MTARVLRVADSSLAFILFSASAEPPRPEVVLIPASGITTAERVVVHAGTNLDVAQPDGSAAAAGTGERLVYSNTLGRFVLRVPANTLVADELTLNAGSNCLLRRFNFIVTGRENPSGAGGPYRVTFALYDNCPSSGGAIVAGTSGQVDFPDDAPRHVEVVIPAGAPLPWPTVWLGLTFNRRNCGILSGAPALVGYSVDVFDLPPYGCNQNLAGWPEYPHGSFRAQVYVDSACTAAFVGFDNPGSRTPAFGLGPGVLLSDDVALQVDGCSLSGFRVRVDGFGFYRFFLWTGPFPPDSTVIPGTERLFEIAADGRHVLQAAFDPPIPVPRSFNVGFLAGNSEAKWVTSGDDPRLGKSPSPIYCQVTDAPPGTGCFEPGFPPPPEGFDLSIVCAGEPPTGACCDMFATQCGGRRDGAPCRDNADCPNDQTCATFCREVPRMNCPWPPDQSTLQPQWMQGAACDPDPFPHPCGVAACCTPQDTCLNRTANECEALPPTYKAREWQRGRYCGEGRQRCARADCYGRTGSCTEARERRCNGGQYDGQLCTDDRDCRSCYCWGNACFPLDCSLSPCFTDADCNSDGQCVVINGMPRCEGGARDGDFCDPDHRDRDCMESYCERFAGCEDPACCSAVCNYAVGLPLFTEFCCLNEWDLQCAELASAADIPECHSDDFIASNDTCGPTAYTDGASEIEINSQVLGR